MRGLIRALVCFGSLAALSSPAVAAPAQAAPADRQTGESARCRMVAVRPVATETAVRAVVSRAGCRERTFVDIQIRVAGPGPDKIIRKATRAIGNGRVAVTTRCTNRPRTYYVVALDREGEFSRSGAVRLSCATPGAPTPSPTATPTTGPTAKPTPTPTNDGGSDVGTAVEREVVRLTNEARRREGCKPLIHDAKLRAAAFGHSSDMARNNYFSHDSRDGKDPGDRIRAAGFSPLRAWGENIAAGQRTAAQAVQAWLDSPGHQANILNCRFTHIGVGVAQGSRTYWTQNFASH